MPEDMSVFYLLEAPQDGLGALVDALLDVVQRGHEADSGRRLQLHVHLW